ncbi:SRPBCC domain-containing protein [Streptomyces sp. DSM 42041]|uniref:SRPBCC domain-containing protein n=1 Tax=Streptomyces hazeniae TaxID=3075538 RepID=A0ABU2NUH8_9ACTN|nr:SRPBCC domain-containing protein [Streptomyces sp. DSM 42041]MDT0380630.1 SRPBCC domain-containing protein [Streptomyces sp. DSM 42041]
MPTGLTRDAGWQIGVSKTLPLPPEAVWDFLTCDEGLALWLGPGARLPRDKGAAYETPDGVRGELRSLRPADRVRLTWRPPGWAHDTTLQVAVSPAPGTAGARTVLRFHQEHLADAAERERQRAHWRSVMDAVTDALTG